MYLIKQIHTLFLTGLFTSLMAVSAFAGIVFDGTPGTSAPPATLGGLTMDAFPSDPRPLFANVSDLPVNSSGSPVIGFSDALTHYRIGNGWATWSHGYTGDVYYRNGNTLTINLPANTRAFYLYIEGNSFGTANIMATANDGTTSGLIPVVGASGATYYGFYTTSSACLLTSIVIEADPAAGGFAVGEFGINILECTDVMACKNLNVSLDKNCEIYITPDMLLSGTCATDKVVELSHYNQPVANPINYHYIGKTLTGKVLDTLTGNSCWSSILIEDKQSPDVLCRDYRVSCKEFEENDLRPADVEDCSHYTVELLDEQIERLDCNDELIKRVTRTWVATDDLGNVSAPCQQIIEVERLDIYTTAFPRDVRLLCDYIYRTDANGHPHPVVTGIPRLDGMNIWPTENFNCNIFVDYEDNDLGEIGCVRKIMRTWRVREWWCSEELTNFATQLIQIVDLNGPVITHSHYDFEATTGHKSCEANVVLPPIEAYDACHNNLRIDVVYPGGILVDQNGGRVNLPVGLDTIIYRVYDGCYNVTEDTLFVLVKDHTEPVAVCDRRTVVAINDSGENWVPAEVFDDGSFDECGLHHFEVRRMDADHCGTRGEDDWGPEVRFCCTDVGREIMVAFKAIDISNNEAVCMVLVEVQDKDMPRITCPPDISVDCRYDYDYSKLGRSFGKVVTEESDREQIVIDPIYWHEIFGHPLDGIAYDNCSPTVTERIDTSGMNQCGMGVIVREFTVTDGQGNSASCLQRVEINNHRPVRRLSIDWPDHFDTTGVCDSRRLLPELLSAPYNVPVVYDDECSIIGMDYTDHIFSATVPGEPCFKIFRVWKVIDWCFRDDFGDIVIYQDTQIIKMNNVVDPVITRVCRDTTICTYDIECRPIAVVLSIAAMDDCTAETELLYRYKIDLDSDGTIDIVRASIGDNTARGTWPLGRHIIKWEVEDRCGNIAKCESELNLLNCKPPTAYCHRDLSIGLTAMDTNGDGVPDIKMAEVWASDLNVNSGHSCGYPVVFSFSADTSDKVRYYNCDSIGPRNVELWVTDINGNQSYCRTVIIIDDNPQQAPACPQTLRDVVVSGLVRTEGSREVENAEIKLEQSSLNSVKTTYEGAYSFAPMKSGGSYTVKPEKNDDWTNGVTTADIVRIQRHILGLEPISSPYKMIAADVNRTKSVTARDISDLRKLILGITQEIPGNRSWRFVPASYSFSDPEEALEETYPEAYSIPQLASDIQSDFVAVKVGDVNESARTRGYQEVSSRTGRTLDLYYTDVQMKRGEVYEIEIKSTNISEFAGFQTTLELQSGAVQLLDVSANRQNKFGDEHYSLHASAAGLIPVSWDGVARDEERMLTLRVRALSDARISDVLRVGSEVTQSLSVGQHSEEGRVELRGTGMLTREFVLLQNEPNPWKEQTSIGLVLPESGTVRLTIYDVTGRIYFKGEREFSKGYQEWILGQDLLENTGVYYYQADFGSHTQTRKMVVIE